MKVFENYAYYYNMFYGDKNYRKEAEIIDKLIKKYKKDSTKILDIGCGTGRHDIELNRIGYEIKGIDISSNMIDVARKNYLKESVSGLQFFVGDARTYRDNECYDVITSLFHVMCYQNSNDDLLAAFSTAHDELVDNGIFIFDAWYGPGVLTDPPAVRIKKVSDETNDIIRYATPVMRWNNNVVDVCYNIHIINCRSSVTSFINEVHSMRYLFKPEIEYMLKQSKFTLIDCIDCATLREPDSHSWTVYFIAQKIN